jgi:hypothetical protein
MVLATHLEDNLDVTGKTVSNGTLQTSDDTGTNRIVIRDDGSEGIIEFYSGTAGETKGLINPSASGGTPSLDIRTSTVSPNTPARILLTAGTNVALPIVRLVNTTLDCDGSASFDSTLHVAGILTGDTEIHANTGGLWMDDLSGGGSTGASIGNSGRVQRTTSSRRYKDDIQPLTLDEARKALDLEPVTYTRKDESDDPDRRTYPGFIAEQAADVGAELWVARDTEGRPDGFRYPELTAALVMLVRDQAERIDRLERMLGHES